MARRSRFTKKPETRRYRVNRQIRMREVRLVDHEGTQHGVVPTDDARRMAEEAGLDLVEVSPNADPPVCRIMDWGKFQYEQRKKSKGGGPAIRCVAPQGGSGSPDDRPPRPAVQARVGSQVPRSRAQGPGGLRVPRSAARPQGARPERHAQGRRRPLRHQQGRDAAEADGSTHDHAAGAQVEPAGRPRCGSRGRSRPGRRGAGAWSSEFLRAATRRPDTAFQSPEPLYWGPGAVICSASDAPGGRAAGPQASGPGTTQGHASGSTGCPLNSAPSPRHERVDRIQSIPEPPCRR